METDCWGFTAVLELISSLSTASVGEASNGLPRQDVPSTPPGDDALGNFDALWNFLGCEKPLTNDASTLNGPETPSNGSLGGLREQDLDTTGKSSELHSPGSTELEAVPTLAKSKRQRRKENKKEGFKESYEVIQGRTLQYDISQDEATAKRGQVVQTINGQLRRRKSEQADLIAGRAVGRNGDEYPSQIPQASSPNPSSQRLQLIPHLVAFQPVPICVSTQLRGENLASSSAKKQELVIMLYTRFIQERPSLQAFMSSSQAPAPGTPNVDKIHVFIDMSNILIGFHNTLKANRGIRKGARTPRMRLSFHNLSLILERGRSTAKRVLVGSDDIDSTQEARLVGYETNILERVQKFKTFLGRERRPRNNTPGPSSGSDSYATQGQVKNVEQAVDEILHLKMSQSIIDSERPSTMVLATGDAAEAEYSDGFLRTVERALKKGWKVELVAFRENTSFAYRKPWWTTQWGSSFTIIELDDYAELLLVE